MSMKAAHEKLHQTFLAAIDTFYAEVSEDLEQGQVDGKADLKQYVLSLSEEKYVAHLELNKDVSSHIRFAGMYQAKVLADQVLKAAESEANLKAASTFVQSVRKIKEVLPEA